MLIKTPYKKASAIIIGALVGVWSQFKTVPQVSHYIIKSKKLPSKFDGLRIAHLSDLHNEVYGERNACLLSLIDEQKPDIVLITGDMISHDQHNMHEYIDLCRNLAKKYVVYYVNGNHELSDLTKCEFKTVAVMLKQAGVICLDNKITTLVCEEQSIALAGLCYDMEYYKGVRGNRRAHSVFTKKKMTDYLGNAPKDEYTILLAHNPLDFDVYAEWGADLSLGGHIHGGLIRLPIVKGILSPEMKFMPKYKEGVYDKNGKKLVVSRGLGSVRIFNRAELVTVELKCK